MHCTTTIRIIVTCCTFTHTFTGWLKLTSLSELLLLLPVCLVFLLSSSSPLLPSTKSFTEGRADPQTDRQTHPLRLDPETCYSHLTNYSECLNPAEKILRLTYSGYLVRFRSTHAHTHLCTRIGACMHTYIHTYIHRCMHAYRARSQSVSLPPFPPASRDRDWLAHAQQQQQQQQQKMGRTKRHTKNMQT